MNINFKNHFILMSGYNTRMNNQVYVAASKLTAEQQQQDVGAYFGSMLNTLNHIMVGDLLWLRRFQIHQSLFNNLNILETFPDFPGLDKLIYHDFGELHQRRKELDQIITNWVTDELTESDFNHSIEYTDTKGIFYKRNFAELLFHLFNHQTHHRGQISTILSQFEHDIGTTDFLIDIPTESSI